MTAAVVRNPQHSPQHSAAPTVPGSWVGRAWSCTVRLLVTDPRALRPATQDLIALLDRVDSAASRFRPDSAISVANDRAGRPTPVPKLLVDLVAAALDASIATDGAVDPHVGLAMTRLGYDRDIASIELDGPPLEPIPTLTSGRRARLDRSTGLLTVPLGTALDLGATAKAWTADHAARALAARYGTGVLVELGGDLAAAGDVPRGWRIRVAEQEGGTGQLITVRHGGLATSTTTIRTWRRGHRQLHHILDPATAQPAGGPWRTASVAGRSALDANTASTAAIVKGDDAWGWLVDHGYAARLVDDAGCIVTTPGWPTSTATAGGTR